MLCYIKVLMCCVVLCEEIQWSGCVCSALSGNYLTWLSFESLSLSYVLFTEVPHTLHHCVLTWESQRLRLCCQNSCFLCPSNASTRDLLCLLDTSRFPRGCAPHTIITLTLIPPSLPYLSAVSRPTCQPYLKPNTITQPKACYLSQHITSLLVRPRPAHRRCLCLSVCLSCLIPRPSPDGGH